MWYGVMQCNVKAEESKDERIGKEGKRKKVGKKGGMIAAADWNIKNKIVDK